MFRYSGTVRESVREKPHPRNTRNKAQARRAKTEPEETRSVHCGNVAAAMKQVPMIPGTAQGCNPVWAVQPTTGNTCCRVI